MFLVAFKFQMRLKQDSFWLVQSTNLDLHLLLCHNLLELVTIKIVKSLVTSIALLFLEIKTKRIRLCSAHFIGTWLYTILDLKALVLSVFTNQIVSNLSQQWLSLCCQQFVSIYLVHRTSKTNSYHPSFGKACPSPHWCHWVLGSSPCLLLIGCCYLSFRIRRSWIFRC